MHNARTVVLDAHTLSVDMGAADITHGQVLLEPEGARTWDGEFVSASRALALATYLSSTVVSAKRTPHGRSSARRSESIHARAAGIRAS